MNTFKVLAICLTIALSTTSHASFIKKLLNVKNQTSQPIVQEEESSTSSCMSDSSDESIEENDLGYIPHMSIVDFFTDSGVIPQANEEFLPEISNFSAAFHQPITRPEHELWWKDSMSEYLNSPTYNCHQIAEDVHLNLGVGEIVTYGGYGQELRLEAVNKAIEVLKKGVPVIIGIHGESKSGGGHSFSLVLRPDGLVDGLEGWAGPDATDVLTGKKRNLSKEKVIKSLKYIGLDASDASNDKKRSRGFGYISQGYTNSRNYHKLSPSEAKAIYNIPNYDPTIELTNQGAYPKDQPFTNVVYLNKNGKLMGISSVSGKVVTGKEILVERRDNKISFKITVNYLDHASKAISKLKKQLDEQLRRRSVLYK